MDPKESFVVLLCVAFVLWFVVAIFVGIWRWITGPKAAPVEVDPNAEFIAAKAVLAKSRLDAETGEYYAYKITRVPADPPASTRPATIAEPIQRRACSN